MAGKDFDPMDIRSEIGAKNVVSPDVTTSTEVTPEEMLKLVAIQENPTPLEEIVPGDVGNEIDVDNPPDFEALNQAFPLFPPLRRSKRQAGYDPNFSEPKKPRPAPKNLLDTDFSSGSDSEDQDFEIVVRPRPQLKTGESSKKTISSDKELPVEDDEDLSLADILASLKKGKKTTTQDVHVFPDAEMMEEFEQNRSGKSDRSISESISSSESEEYAAEKDELDGIESDDVSADSQDVVPDVTNIFHNSDMAEFVLSKSFSEKFYSEDVVALWPLFANRGLIEERIIDMDAYGKQNLIPFLKERKLLASVTNIQPYCRSVVLEFYCNLLSSVGDVHSAKFGKVFVRDRLYDFSPSTINVFLNTPEPEEENFHFDLNAATVVLTGGMISAFPEHPKKLAAANLTSFYSILHKTAVKNWTPSSNTTVVTRNQAPILFAIGTGLVFDFGKLVFENIRQFAEGGCQGMKLPFPSLIYGIMVSQGFIRHIHEDCIGASETFKIAPGYFKGNRKIDIPWSSDHYTSAIPTASASEPVHLHHDFTEFIKFPTSFVQSQIDFGLSQIEHAKAQIKIYTDQVALFENQVADYRLLLEVGVFSEQKGGVEDKNDEVEEEQE